MDIKRAKNTISDVKIRKGNGKNMNIIIGKIAEDGKDRAYMLYSVEEQKRMIITRDAVKNAMIDGMKIVGFELRQNYYGAYGLHKTKSYIWKKMPELNGKGKAKTEADEAVEIFIGTNGFKEVKVYVTINASGIIRVYSKDNFIRRMETDEYTIIGAAIKLDSDQKEIRQDIKNMLTDTWMERLGFERNAEFNWMTKQVNEEGMDNDSANRKDNGRQ